MRGSFFALIFFVASGFIPTWLNIVAILLVKDYINPD